MADKVDVNDVIERLANKIGWLEAQNAILESQLKNNKAGDESDKQNTKS